ncbi:MAG TPA: hypothetical protein VFP91_13985 [Vicinamibacterales bacterium]|nr:hypothetical protein [Vicinamibacterales bacterium]
MKRQIHRVRFAIAKQKPRRQRLNAIEEFDVVLLTWLDEIRGVREVLA